MKISVLLPVYNNEKNVNYTIESILKQTYSNFEVIIVNDGSTDNTLEILNSYQKKDKRIKIINKQTNSGVIDSLNIGLKKCSSDYVIRHDSEDVSYYMRFKILVDALNKNKDVSFIATRSFILNEKYKTIGVWPLRNTKNLNKLIDKGIVPIADPSAIYRRKDIFKVGSYLPTAQYCENYDLCLRMRNEGMNFMYLNQPLYGFIRAKTGVSYDHREEQVRNTYIIQGKTISDTELKNQVAQKWVRDKIVLGIDHDIKINIYSKSVFYAYLLKCLNFMLIWKYKNYIKGFFN
jgi:glycosyltransferase involved in cell wall biosynthesis